MDRSMFKNCLDVIRTDEGWMPLRFTNKQLEGYRESERLEKRSYCPAGICMDIETNSSFFKLNYSIISKTREFAFFDIYIDDIFMKSVGSKTMELGKHELYIDLSDNPRNENELRRLTIYLPFTAVVNIHHYETQEDSLLKFPAVHRKNLLCLGDSITQGMDSLHPAATYPIVLSRHFNMNVLNQGVGGYFFEAKSLDQALPYTPDLITVAYGTNDWSRYSQMQDFVEACTQYISTLVSIYSSSIPIFLITPLWRRDIGENKEIGSLAACSDQIKSICEPYPQITVIDGMELIPHLPEYFTDGLHPTNEGFLYMSLQLIKKISEADQ